MNENQFIKVKTSVILESGLRSLSLVRSTVSTLSKPLFIKTKQVLKYLL